MRDPLRHSLVEQLPHLRRFALELTGSAADADDLVQEACERALLNAQSWQPGTRLDSWMCRIIQNLWIDSRRRAGRRGEHLEIAQLDAAVPALQTRPAAETRSDLAQVERVLRQMPEAQRSVLMLTCIQGLSHRECATVLNIPIGTVMSRLARARESLHRHWQTT